jgi:hypothetical protein
MDREDGSASVYVLVVLVLLSSLALGVYGLVGAGFTYERRSTARSAQRRELEEALAAVLAALADDPTPEADTPNDPVWQRIGWIEGAVVELADVSSRVNPNWVRKNLLEKTRIGSLMEPGASPDGLQQYREETGFHMNVGSAYETYFRDDAMERYLSPYGYANINVTDEFALRRLYALRTGDHLAAEAFHGRVQQLLRERRLIHREGLREFLGSKADLLLPVMNVEPVWNVHFAEELLLQAVLDYPELQVPDPSAALSSLLASREGGGTAAEDLPSIIGAPPESRVYQYLGLTTWFWRVHVSIAGASLHAVVARTPAISEDGEDRFQVVRHEYSVEEGER